MFNPDTSTRYQSAPEHPGPDDGIRIKPQALSRKQVAALLGIGETTFEKKRPALEAAGFPPRLPGIARWSRLSILAWLASNGAAPVVAPGQRATRPALAPLSLTITGRAA
jgi:hypothetical protein